ncbi:MULTISPECIES: cytochrome d ubiquinol oxidase subunit II [Psychrobacter]|uniref:Cytochrome d ubiquinol oxidase subunit II n=2 Tax=Psychrobacter TaxID=497 RepID=A0A844LXV2_9GAMM|nr:MULTISPECIES: cytochrome d ubiquinol oxidase subunit II [Psychrobacter]MUG31501.1 cytochrome d ubiquinol oxidase subunit II [Psychrobacter sanguinis]
MLFDYATLKLIWWLLVGVLLIGFAIMDGHDMGVGSLLPFVGKNDDERRVVINSIGAHWEGNQVWFITAGGALFAAWPMVYALAFSGFYWAMMAVLWALFFRPVGFKYRNLVKDQRWRNAWDWGLFVGSFVPAVVFGVAFGNLFLGVPFSFDQMMRSTYTGSFFQLLNPFALLCGLVSVTLLIMQGGAYLAHRTEGVIQDRTVKYAMISAIVMVVLFVGAGVWIQSIDGYAITSQIDPAALANPLTKEVVVQPGAWMANYAKYPMAWAFPALGIIMPLLTAVLLKARKTLTAFVTSSLAIVGVIMTAGVSLFPFIMPSSTAPNASLTIWDSVSSHLTLMVMLYVVVLLLPIVVFYTSWAYSVMRGKVTVAYIRENDHTSY